MLCTSSWDEIAVRFRCVLGGIVLCAAVAANGRATELGQFEGHADIGKTGQAGSVEHNTEGEAFTVKGGGDDMWGTADAFQFLYKQASGDVSLTADIRWIGEGGHKNRKACFLVRQSLEPGSAYVDLASHGDGHIAVQWRTATDGKTGDVGSKVVSAPKTIRIEKRGDEFQTWAAAEGGELQPIGKPYRLHLDEPFYIGLGVCSHDSNKLEAVEFSKVVIKPLGADNVPK
jgi:TolB protein